MLHCRHPHLLGLLLAAASALTAFADQPRRTGPEDPEGEARIAGLRVPDELSVQLVAASPQVDSPVAICVDAHNRIYAAEVHRFNRGTEENRNRTFLLNEDLRNQTVSDRVDSYRTFLDQFGGSMDYFTRYSDRVVRLADEDGDGRVDLSTVFAEGFTQPSSGLGSGVIARDGIVWYTNIPNLWRLEDLDGDGTADRREVLVSGFGVQNAFLGHDLHGLAWGPDGKLYFSVGDRGFHVETEGQIFHGPRMGAIFRCNPDGTQFEVVFTGLRNPQELAFDDWGNLFTADNNCDKGDYGRLVYVVEGGSAGWNMAYQTLPEPYLTGPWHAEGIWNVHPSFASHADPLDSAANPHLATPQAKHNPQPAWIVPPVAAIGAGPAGLVCHPGVGPLERLAGHLLMCNFTGNGGLEAFTLEPAGAGFRLEAVEDVCKPIMATDVEFTFDGRILLSDYVQLNWDGSSGGGRIYSLGASQPASDFDALAKLASQSFDSFSTEQLAGLLAHRDRRIRQRAQAALVRQAEPGAALMAQVVRDRGADTLARVHALWGLGQLGHGAGEAWNAVRETLEDPDPRLCAQAARVCGWAADRRAQEALIRLLRSRSPRVQLYAAEAIGKLGDAAAIEPLFALLRTNADRDPLIRHVAIFALVQLGAMDAAVDSAHHPDESQRLASVVILRRAADPRVAGFLGDSNMEVVTEAARAINDLPLESATLALARWHAPAGHDVATIPEALWRRVINSCFRMGDVEFAERVAEIAADERLSDSIRSEAVEALGDWTGGEHRDRVTGFWRPLAPRDPALFQRQMAARLADLPDRVPIAVRGKAIQLIDALRIEPRAGALARWLDPELQPVETRAAAARLLARDDAGTTQPLLDAALADPASEVRIVAREVWIEKAPELAGEILSTIVVGEGSATTAERQAALQLVSRIEGDVAAEMVRQGLDRLEAGRWPVALSLDLLQAADQIPDLRERARVYRAAQSALPYPQRDHYLTAGGDEERGRWLFFNHAAAQCVRCHRIGLDGGVAGPSLDGVASRHPEHTRAYFLQSLQDPSAQFAPGFEQATILTTSGSIIAGTVTHETDERVTVTPADGRSIDIRVDEIEARNRGQSPMPSVGDALTPQDLRDLVEFLSTLR